eukprot:156853-Rhodomonas_salina.1
MGLWDYDLIKRLKERLFFHERENDTSSAHFQKSFEVIWVRSMLAVKIALLSILESFETKLQ